MATFRSHRRPLRSSLSSAPAPATAKRSAVSSENVGGVGKVMGGAQSRRKRSPLRNLTNQTRRASVGPTPSIVPCTAAKSSKPPKKSSASSINSTKTNVGLPQKTCLPRNEVVPLSKISLPKCQTLHISIPQEPCCMDISPSPSDGRSFSVDDESMSSCGSLKSPDVIYLDENDVAGLGSIERKTFNNLHIYDHGKIAESVCKREILAEMEMDRIVNVDDKYSDPQFCATMASDVYKHLRASETKKRPATNFMEKVQKDINASMRAILVDWLVEVAEEYRLVPDTLYLTINYIDRYLSGNAMNRQQLQLLGVACMMIAAKYEEICPPQVEEFCYITDNTYFKDEVLDMESVVLNYLKFEMTAPTTKCFLRRFVRAAQAMTEIPSLRFEFLANYIAELSMLEYKMLQYAPSLIAASSVFLAKYILNQSQPPWNSTLKHYTFYEPSDLHSCVKELHELCLNSCSSSLPAIREKYNQHKYKFVAKKYCPPSIPAEFFHDTSS